MKYAIAAVACSLIASATIVFVRMYTPPVEAPRTTFKKVATIESDQGRGEVTIYDRPCIFQDGLTESGNGLFGVIKTKDGGRELTCAIKLGAEGENWIWSTQKSAN